MPLGFLFGLHRDPRFPSGGFVYSSCHRLHPNFSIPAQSDSSVWPGADLVVVLLGRSMGAFILRSGKMVSEREGLLDYGPVFWSRFPQHLRLACGLPSEKSSGRGGLARCGIGYGVDDQRSLGSGHRFIVQRFFPNRRKILIANPGACFRLRFDEIIGATRERVFSVFPIREDRFWGRWDQHLAAATGRNA